ncbi:uncharacterized protein LOC111398118 [Olea europaea var. sylvestris]|uniref:uncharacterized protein LOC111398118 n=1 Tax=Olea europaea var. sylvestris TaxID=158386 RepID=UPI000C1CEA59|nr:uncharacterized protein LOC111398118 [Olea europaea var. sylvestris]
MADNTIIEEVILESTYEGPQGDNIFQDEEVIPNECQLIDSNNEVNDNDFHYDNNANEQVLIGLKADHTIELLTTGDEEVGSDEAICPSEEELHTNYSSSEEQAYHFPIYDAEREKFDPQLEVGKEFKNIEEFKEAVRNHGAASRCNFRFKPNDEFRAQAICKLACTWKIWASWNKKKGCVQIKSKNPEHTCIRNRTNRHCTAKYKAKRYLDTFKVDLNWKSKLIIKAVNDDMKLTINKVTAWMARRYARVLIQGSNEHHFGLLRSFAVEILRTNPGSTCIVAIHDLKFQGVYICLEACKRGFFGGCRQLLVLDGCFLKGTFGGQMLVAVELDANHYIYPVAYAIVERENATTWRWFIQHLGEDLKIMNSNEWTFMTDRQKGLQNVIDDLYLEAKHRFCVRHMYINFFRIDFKGLILKEYIWKAAKSTMVLEWMFWMGEMEKESSAAHNWLKKRHPSEGMSHGSMCMSVIE